RIVIQVIERVRSRGSLEQREIQGFHQDPFAVVEGFELTKWVRQAGLARKMGAPFDSGSVYHGYKDPVGEGGRDGQMVVRVQTVKRSLGLLGPGGWCDYEFRALVREEGRELGELEVVTHLQADAMAFEVDDHGVGSGIEDQRLSVPKVDLPVDGRARRSRREGGVVERPTGTLRKSARDEASRRPGRSLDGSEGGEPIDMGLRLL